VRIDRLSGKVLQEWKLWIEQKGLSLCTKHHAYGDLRAMLNYAVRMEYLPKNPISKIDNYKDTSSLKSEMKFYTAQEFAQFIGTVKKLAQEREQKHKDLYEWAYFVFFNIAFYTGLRKGEINALKWVDIDGSYLSVKRSVSQKLRGEDIETPPKNRSSLRTLQMPLPLIKILDEHKKRQMQCFKNFSDDFRVCGGERCLRDSSIQNKNEQCAQQSGIKRIRIHDYRHSHASLLANEGINIQEVARRLGHAKIEMTWNTYSHLYPREEEKAVSVLNSVI